MKSKLKAISPKEAAPSKPKILIYGKPGVGKTWASLDFPKCYYIDTEGGANLAHYTQKLLNSGGAYLGVDEGSLDFTNVIEQVRALGAESHNYKTIVIDSFTRLFNNEVAREAEKLGEKDVFGASRKPAVSLTKRLLSLLLRLDMNVILIAHEKSAWGIVNNQRAEIGTTFDAYDRLEYDLHLVLNIIKLPNKRMAIIKKSRLQGFPDGESFAWNYDEFAMRYGKELIESKVVALEFATAEQLIELRNLIERTKLPTDYIEKCLLAADVFSLEELDSIKIQKIIDHIKDKFK